MPKLQSNLGIKKS